MKKWRIIPGYSGYLVSTEGEIISQRRFGTTGGNIKINSNEAGYKYAQLRKDGKNHKVFVHRAVALAFIPNPENKAQVNHINGVKADNNVCNLEWATASENLKHAYATGLKGKGKTK